MANLRRYNVEIVSENEEETRGWQTDADLARLIKAMQVGDALVINRVDDAGPGFI